VLRKKEARMPTNWSRRYKTTPRAPLGDIYQSPVVRTSDRDKDKAVGRREAHALEARQILVSELPRPRATGDAEQRLNDALP